MTISDPELIRQWEQDGYVLLKQAVPRDLIDQVNSEVREFRRTCGETKDEHGYGQRIGLFHTKSRKSLEIAQNREVRAFLRWAFGDEPLLYGSLMFEAGTEQPAHQDSIFFLTNPDHAMAGVWVSLEDVHDDAGPLFYYRGSHRWGLDRAEEVWRAFPELHARVRKLTPWKPGEEQERIAVAGELGNAWYVLLADKIKKRGEEPVRVLIAKGDALIWHAHLVHGGSPRRNRALSRRSLVTHHIGRKAAMFDMTTFFLREKHEFDRRVALAMTVVEDEFGPHVRHEKPVTY